MERYLVTFGLIVLVQCSDCWGTFRSRKMSPAAEMQEQSSVTLVELPCV